MNLDDIPGVNNTLHTPGLSGHVKLDAIFYRVSLRGRGLAVQSHDINSKRTNEQRG
jgi:hypothetical protein